MLLKNLGVAQYCKIPTSLHCLYCYITSLNWLDKVKHGFLNQNLSSVHDQIIPDHFNFKHSIVFSKLPHKHIIEDFIT